MSKEYTNREFGALGEKLAVRYLKDKHYKILEKNYKCALGEVDIIARYGDFIVFAEVKTRSAEPFLSGVYAVDSRKREHIMRVASQYIREKKCALQPRFDIIAVEIDRSTGKPVKADHIENAFIQTGGYAKY